MPDLTVQAAKRRQAVQITVFLVFVAVGVTVGYHWIRRDAVAFRRAENAFARGDYTTAAELYDQARALGLRVDGLTWRHAQALIETGRKEDALALLKEFLAQRPGDPDALAAASGLAQALGRPDEALALYAGGAGAQREPDARELVRLADLHQQAGKLEQAIALARRARDAAPDNADVRVLLANYLSRVDRRAEALEEVAVALRLDPTHRAGLLVQARLLAWERRYAESINAYRAYVGP